MAEKQHLIIHDRLYQFCKWLYPTVANYPKTQRYVLGEQTQKLATDIMLGAIQANAEQSKTATLADLVVKLRQLKTLIRLAMELKYIAFRQYEYAAGLLDEVGRLLWGWLRATLDKSVPHNYYLEHAV